MVEVRYRDRLGNNLFQYCLGRILAEHFGYTLQATPLEGFSRTNDSIIGAEHTSPEEILEGQRIDLDAVLRDSSPRKIVLNGWFQRHEYFTPHRERIQSWLTMDAEHLTPCADADVVVNVRRTDYIGLGWALPFSFYEEAIERAIPNGGRVTIVTDDPADTFFYHFRRWRPAFFKGTPLQQMSYMSNAPRLVMSASTFSWWPAFLGQAQTVVCPVPCFGIWAPGPKGQDINLIDHSRFVCIDCPVPYNMNVMEKLYQRARSYRTRTAAWSNQTFRTNFPVKKF